MMRGVTAGSDRFASSGREDHRGDILKHRKTQGGGAGVAGEEARGLSQMLFGLWQPAATKGGGHHRATGAAQEQRLAEVLFDQREGDGQRGLADMQRLCRRRQATVAGDGAGIVDLAQGDR